MPPPILHRAAFCLGQSINGINHLTESLSMAELPTDYIIIGGGLCGCALAARLYEKNKSLSILIVEAGPDVKDHPLTSAPLASFQAHHSALDWAYSTVPQAHLDGRECYASAGKALSGSTANNYGTWTRGPANCYDTWAKLVGDESWNYDGFLPYFKATETHFEPKGDAAVHGMAGPIHTASVSSSSANRKYPQKDQLLSAWDKVGVRHIADGNSGSPIGASEMVENWREGKRQLASEAYSISSLPGISVMTNTMVKRVVIEERDGKKSATGVELVDGRRLSASNEVIVSAGAYRTPQVLMLSGIGPSDQLAKHKITQVVDLPEVGRGFHDHFSLAQWWKLRNPAAGQAIGTALWKDPGYYVGLPCDWVIVEKAPHDELKRALEADGESGVETHPFLAPDYCHTETLVVYAPAGAAVAGVDIPVDGTHIASAVLGMSPTSRGSITLASADPLTPPLIDPNYYATAFDRVSLRAGIRQVMKVLLETSEGSDLVECEVPPPGFNPLNAESTDEEIDKRVKKIGNTFYHPAGSAAMGPVVDTKLRVKGVTGLRVVDASVLPLPIVAHYQACLYALAEKAALIISS